jgi:hypothetical protein
MDTRRFGIPKANQRTKVIIHIGIQQTLIYWCPRPRKSSDCHRRATVNGNRSDHDCTRLFFSPITFRLAGHTRYACQRPSIAPGTGSPNHDNCAIGGDPSDSYEQERRSGPECSRKLIVS